MRRSLLPPAVAIAALVAFLPGAGRGAGRADDHRASLSLDRAPLTKVVSELTRHTGVRHRVTTDGARQHLVMYCKEQPAAAVRAAISNLLGWTWTRGNDNGDPAYTLVRGQALLRQEAELR